jgi:hypothetical protein
MIGAAKNAAMPRVARGAALDIVARLGGLLLGRRPIRIGELLAER